MRRLFRFTGVVFFAWREVRRHRGREPELARRAEPLHRWAGMVLDAIGVRVAAGGLPPRDGLLVSNHLSYLDILVYSSILPCAFVSKAEVAHWPIIGPFARFSGTIFIHRQQRGNSWDANSRIGACLQQGVPVVLFPEGTTTNGHQVLRFHSSMLQSAIDQGEIITPCAISYELDDGNPATEVCWWGDMTLTPHVWNLLTKREVRAKVIFGLPFPATGDRKELAKVAHEKVLELYETVCNTAQPELAAKLESR